MSSNLTIPTSKEILLAVESNFFSGDTDKTKVTNGVH